MKPGTGGDALWVFLPRHCVLSRAGVPLVLEDIASRENVRGAMKAKVLIHLDEILVVERRLHDRVAHRILQRLCVRLRARAPIHLTGGEDVALVRGVRAEHVVELHDALVHVHLDSDGLHVRQELRVRVLDAGHEIRTALDEDDALLRVLLRDVRRDFDADQAAADDQDGVAVLHHRRLRLHLSEPVLPRGVVHFDVRRVARSGGDEERVERHDGALRADLDVGEGDGRDEAGDVLAVGHRLGERRGRQAESALLQSPRVRKHHRLRGDFLEVILGINQSDVEPLFRVGIQREGADRPAVSAAENHDAVLRLLAALQAFHLGHYLVHARLLLLEQRQRECKSLFRLAERSLQRLEHGVV